jgi:hypothetical protein
MTTKRRLCPHKITSNAAIRYGSEVWASKKTKNETRSIADEIIKTTFKPKQTGQKTNATICPKLQVPSILQ